MNYKLRAYLVVSGIVLAAIGALTVLHYTEPIWGFFLGLALFALPWFLLVMAVLFVLGLIWVHVFPTDSTK